MLQSPTFKNLPKLTCFVSCDMKSLLAGFNYIAISDVLRINDLFKIRVTKHICGQVSDLSSHCKPIKKSLSKTGDYKAIIL